MRRTIAEDLISIKSLLKKTGKYLKAEDEKPPLTIKKTKIAPKPSEFPGFPKKQPKEGEPHYYEVNTSESKVLKDILLSAVEKLDQIAQLSETLKKKKNEALAPLESEYGVPINKAKTEVQELGEKAWSTLEKNRGKLTQVEGLLEDAQRIFLVVAEQTVGFMGSTVGKEDDPRMNSLREARELFVEKMPEELAKFDALLAKAEATVEQVPSAPTPRKIQMVPQDRTKASKHKADVIATDPDYWDCECDGPLENFIHPKSQKSCPKCGTFADEQPDSRVNEVAQLKEQQKKASKRKAEIKAGDPCPDCGEPLPIPDCPYCGCENTQGGRPCPHCKKMVPNLDCPDCGWVLENFNPQAKASKRRAEEDFALELETAVSGIQSVLDEVDALL